MRMFLILAIASFALLVVNMLANGNDTHKVIWVIAIYGNTILDVLTRKDSHK